MLETIHRTAMMEQDELEDYPTDQEKIIQLAENLYHEYICERTNGRRLLLPDNLHLYNRGLFNAGTVVVLAIRLETVLRNAKANFIIRTRLHFKRNMVDVDANVDVDVVAVDEVAVKDIIIIMVVGAEASLLVEFKLLLQASMPFLPSLRRENGLSMVSHGSIPRTIRNGSRETTPKLRLQLKSLYHLPRLSLRRHLWLLLHL